MDSIDRVEQAGAEFCQHPADGAAELEMFLNGVREAQHVVLIRLPSLVEESRQTPLQVRPAVDTCWPFNRASICVMGPLYLVMSRTAGAGP